MKKVLVIENELNDFQEIVKNFEEWEIYPKSSSEIKSFEIADLTTYVFESLNNHDEILAIIVDIALMGQSDKIGLDLIRNIRNYDDDESIRFKIIPIFCYSGHDEHKLEAFKAGATNFFPKASLVDGKDVRYVYLRQSLEALTFQYLDAMEVAQRLSNFSKIMDKLKETHIDNTLIINAVLQLLSFSDLDTLIDSDEKENALNQRLEPEVLQNLRKVKLAKENKELLEKQLDDIAGILSSIPGLSPFAAIFKSLKLLSRSIW